MTPTTNNLMEINLMDERRDSAVNILLKLKIMLWTLLCTLTIALNAWSDGVVMATQEDMSAFDNMIKADHMKKAESLKKEKLPAANFGNLVKDEATKLKNEGPQGRGAQVGKWIVHQRKANRADDDNNGEAKANKRTREREGERQRRYRNYDDD